MKNIKTTILKIIAISVFVLFLFSLSSCKKTPQDTDVPDTTANNINKADQSTTEPDTTESEETTSAIKILPLPEDSMEFTFLSGAGAWRTIMDLNADGTFSGIYLDSNLGDTGDGYPKGSVRICKFSGQFTDIEKIHEYSYKMTLTNLTFENSVGEEWIKDEIRYIACEPNGLTGGTEFAFYLPSTPVAPLSEDFLFWWPLKYEHNTSPKDSLSCYGILNVANNDGFFGGY